MRDASKWDLIVGLGWLGFAALSGHAYAVGSYAPSDPGRAYVLFSAGLGAAFVLRYASARFRRYEPFVYGGIAGVLAGVASYFATFGANSGTATLVGAMATVSGMVALYGFHQRRSLWRSRYGPLIAVFVGVAFVSFGVYLRARFPESGVTAMALTSAVVGIVALAWALRTMHARESGTNH